MNKNLDLTKILEGCPIGTKLYSPLLGEVEFAVVNSRRGFIGVHVGFITKYIKVFDSNGKYLLDVNSPSSECLLFPSKDQRDWSKFERFWDKPKVEKIEKFDPKTLRPFDKVLVRDEDCYWTADLFSHIDDSIGRVCCSWYSWKQCIPYNEETKHLVGTSDDCPEYYKWWEE